MAQLPELFGSMVFNDAVMRERLSDDIYTALKESTRAGKRLTPEVADAVARAMKDWAVERGATHYTHWFQPLNGITAEKHDSFVTPRADGTAIMKFSGHALVQGESDASSFPSGGLRATFEARGYTIWDPTSYAFIKDSTLCIPTAFYSYGGEALDKKTPLLRSMKALDREARRILKLFGTEADKVVPTMGAEQEYFLLDRDTYNQRRDIAYTGRTLFGARPPKGQELDEHYCGMIRLRVSAYMRELDEELWKLGVAAKTEHNEVAPAQHELACEYNTSNVTCDHNQLCMEVMRKVAKRNGLTCVFHEKPFEGVNGSGKHLNWSLAAGGVNLLDPGRTPEENAQFLTFFCAVLKAVDEYPELLRASVSSSSNDHRLGGFEAPPAILSIFVGDELDAVLSSIESGSRYSKKDVGILGDGVDELPSIPRDSTDRNRTSPFAFTGNRFEFRMPGSAASPAGPNTIINTIVAEALSEFADELEKAEDFPAALHELIKRTIREHRRIIFNGNGYGPEWIREAEKRGLVNIKSAPEAIPHILDQKNVDVMEKQGVYTRKELASRCEIMLESYCKTSNVEAQTMLEMARCDILPAVLRYERELASGIAIKRGVDDCIPCRAETSLLKELSALTDKFSTNISALERVLHTAHTRSGDEASLANYYRDSVLKAMDALRATADKMETLTVSSAWPFPTYGTLLYKV